MNPPPRFDRFRRELAATSRLAAPVALVQLGLMFMGVVDTMMLGHLSADALAAGALGHISTVGLMILGNGVISALDPLVSQAHGAGDRQAVGAHLQRGIVLALALVLPCALLLWDVRPILQALGQPAAITAEAAAFAHATIWGLPGYFVFITFRQTLQAMSVVRQAAVAIVLGNLANALGNWLLIFGHFGLPALGVRGSAYSTSICRTAMCLWLLFASRRALAPYWRGFTREAFDVDRLLRLLRIGLPIGLHQSIEALLFIAVSLLMGRMGIVQLAGHQIAINMVSVSFMIPLGISGAAATRVGNAVGRQDMPGARRAAAACLLLGGGVMLFFSTLFAVIPEALARLYTQDPAVIAMTALLLPVAAVFQVFDGIQVVAAGVLRGVADTTLPAGIALLGFWLIGVPAGWYLAFNAGEGPRGLWWGLTAGLITVALLFVARIAHRFRGAIGRV
jgi:MATE family multidrug resistance protein